MENFKFGVLRVGLKIFRPKYQKAHPYTKFGQVNRLAYVPVAVF